MKEIAKRISEILLQIFGYGIMITLSAGGLTFFGYLAAILIGGETASAICSVIYKSIIPVIIKVTTCMILLGLVAMYLAGEHELQIGKRKKK